MKTCKKTRNVKIILLVGVILLLTIGCEETTITTKVFPDGSCQRTIMIKSDSDDLSKDSFPIPLDDSWTYSERKEEKRTEEKVEKKEIKKENQKDDESDTLDKGIFHSTTARSLQKEKEKNYIYTASKSFSHVRDLNEEFFRNPKGNPKVKRFVKLEKSFRWFYTFLTYREVCKELNPFKRIPLDEYFSQEEVEIVKLSLTDEDKAEELYSKEKLEEIEEKFDEWMVTNVFEEVYAAFVQSARIAKVPGLTPETLNSQRESFFKVFKNNVDVFDNLSLDMVFKTCEEVFNREDVQQLRDQGKDSFKQLEGKLAEWENIDIFSGFTHKVLMPGLIVETNAKTVEGSTVTWDAGILKYLIMDYEMWVESRIVNWWAIGIAALLLVLIITALVIGTLRRPARK